MGKDFKFYKKVQNSRVLGSVAEPGICLRLTCSPNPPPCAAPHVQGEHKPCIVADCPGTCSLILGPNAYCILDIEAELKAIQNAVLCEVLCAALC